MFKAKYYSKLENEYGDLRILDKILNPKISKQNNFVKNNNNNNNLIILEQIEGNYLYIDGDQRIYNECKDSKMILPIIQINRPNYKYISKKTNCVNGTFHTWNILGKQLECSICKILFENKNEEDKKEEKKDINNKYNKNILSKLSLKYCYKGDYHVFNEKNICIKCDMNSNNLKITNEKDMNSLINYGQSLNIYCSLLDKGFAESKSK
jgi:hypothetical protein